MSNCSVALVSLDRAVRISFGRREIFVPVSMADLREPRVYQELNYTGGVYRGYSVIFDFGFLKAELVFYIDEGASSQLIISFRYGNERYNVCHRMCSELFAAFQKLYSEISNRGRIKERSEKV